MDMHTHTHRVSHVTDDRMLSHNCHFVVAIRNVSMCVVVLLMSLSLSLSVAIRCGTCRYGYFQDDLKEFGEPIVSYIAGGMPPCTDCIDDSKELCEHKARVQAEQTMTRASIHLCNVIKYDMTNLRVSAYYKLCDYNWGYTGYTSTQPLCCHEGERVSCS